MQLGTILPFRIDTYIFTISLGLVYSIQGLSSENDVSGSMEHIEVIGLTPLAQGLNTENLPFTVQVFGKEALQQNNYYSVADMLGERAGSVTMNAAQNNRLQPDLQFRGFTASPLLGVPQGMAVYQNGIRVNEVFGDTVNWDLLPASFVETMHLVAGSNPVYGLNALGGAIIIQTRTGFSDETNRLGATIGSGEARELEFSSGGNSGQWGYFLSFSGMEEDGWRDYSESEVCNLYAALSWRSENRELDLFYNWGDTQLRGNGSVPEVLLAEDRSAVFTHPDITENALGLISLSYQQWGSENSQLNINLFHRRNNAGSFNGDGSEFEGCERPLEAGYLCDDDEGQRVKNQYGHPVSDEWDAINNRSNRDQSSAGLSMQWIQAGRWAGQWQQVVVGADYYGGETEFESNVEFAALTEDRGTQGSALFHRGGDTLLKSRIRTASVYVATIIDLSERLNLTLSTRYNDTRIQNEDPSGQNVELFGDHSYKRLNGGVGATYQWADDVLLYTNIQQTSRTPSPVEMACSHAEAPCNLPNTFLADPPLDDVVALGGELGLRSTSGSWLSSWRVGLFHTTNRDDIIFQTTGGVLSNQGYFTNAVDTVRKGVEIEAAGFIGKLRWHGSYTYLHASFDDSFTSSTPNHPESEDGSLYVSRGNRIPGLPDQQLKLGLDYDIIGNLVIGGGLQAYSGQFLRGDEANLDIKISGYSIVNLYSSWRPTQGLELQFRIDNVFDKAYESFGLYGEADEVLGDIGNEGNRFLGPGLPRQFWLSVNYTW